MDYSVNNLSRWCFSLLVIAYLVFIGSASFYFSGEVASLDAAMDRAFFSTQGFKFNLHNLRDISTNFLLYMPLGFLVALTLASTRKLALLSIHMGWGVVLSLLIEIMQAFIGRYSDITDVFSNGTGYLIGFVIAHMSIRIFALSPPVMLGMVSLQDDDRLNNITGMRFIYLTIAAFSSLLPLNISVSLTVIYGKLTAEDGTMPRLLLNPLFHFQNSLEFLQYLILNTLVFVPLAYLSAHIQILRRQPSLFLPAWHCLFFGLAVEISNVFIRSGRSDVLLPLLGFGVGVSVSYLLLRFSRTRQRDLHFNKNADRHYLFLSGIVFYGVLVLVVTLSPFEFETSLGEIRTKLMSSSNFVPFMAHFSSRSVAAAIDIVRETLLYAPLGALLAIELRASRLVSWQSVLVLAALLGGTYAIFMELLQLMVVGRFVDLTDCLLATLGSLGGATISPLFRINHDEDPGSQASK